MSGWTTGSQSQSGYSSAELARMQREAEARVLEMQERSRRVLEDGPRYPDFVKKPQTPRAYTETTPHGMPQEATTQGQSAFGAAQGLPGAGQDAHAARGSGGASAGHGAERGAAQGGLGTRRGAAQGGLGAERGTAQGGMGAGHGAAQGGMGAGRGTAQGGMGAGHGAGHAERGGRSGDFSAAGPMNGRTTNGAHESREGHGGRVAYHDSTHEGHGGQAASWDGANASLPTPKAQTLPHHPIPEPEEKRGGLLGMLGGSLGGLLKGGGDGPISRVMDALGIDNDKIIVLVLLLILLNNNADKKLILALCYILL